MNQLKDSNSLVALLPMKGHSERVPNKNLKLFNGKPLYHAIISTLNKSQYIKKIVINTDSELIKADVLENFNYVTIIDRPASIRGDNVPMNDIINYDLFQLDGENFLQTHSSNPLLSSKTLDLAINKYFDNLDERDSLFSVTKYLSRFYWQNGEPVNHDPEKLLRTQDLPPIFKENSNLYIFSKESFKNADNNRIGLSPQMFEMDKLESIDIDEPEDFILAELLYKQLRGKDE